jgi:hypothetical protein
MPHIRKTGTLAFSFEEKVEVKDAKEFWATCSRSATLRRSARC